MADYNSELENALNSPPERRRDYFKKEMKRGVLTAEKISLATQSGLTWEGFCERQTKLAEAEISRKPGLFDKARDVWSGSQQTQIKERQIDRILEKKARMEKALSKSTENLERRQLDLLNSPEPHEPPDTYGSRAVGEMEDYVKYKKARDALSEQMMKNEKTRRQIEEQNRRIKEKETMAAEEAYREENERLNRQLAEKKKQIKEAAVSAKNAAIGAASRTAKSTRDYFEKDYPSEKETKNALQEKTRSLRDSDKWEAEYRNTISYAENKMINDSNEMEKLQRKIDDLNSKLSVSESDLRNMALQSGARPDDYVKKYKEPLEKEKSETEAMAKKIKESIDRVKQSKKGAENTLAQIEKERRELDNEIAAQNLLVREQKDELSRAYEAGKRAAGSAREYALKGSVMTKRGAARAAAYAGRAARRVIDDKKGYEDHPDLSYDNTRWLAEEGKDDSTKLEEAEKNVSETYGTDPDNPAIKKAYQWGAYQIHKIEPEEHRLPRAFAWAKKKLDAEARKHAKKDEKRTKEYMEKRRKELGFNRLMDELKRLGEEKRVLETTKQRIENEIDSGSKNLNLGPRLRGITDEINEKERAIRETAAKFDAINAQLASEMQNKDFDALYNSILGEVPAIIAEAIKRYHIFSPVSRADLRSALEDFAKAEASEIINNEKTIYSGAINKVSRGVNAFYDWWATTLIGNIIFSPVTAGLLITGALAFIANMNMGFDMLYDTTFIIMFLATIALAIFVSKGNKW